MTDIERLRHSTAHVLATAILKIWPDAQFAAGPPVENGFYYDVELEHRISPDDFEKIEAEMKKEVKANHPFERVNLSRSDALSMAERGALGALGERPAPSKFKLDIIQNIPDGEEISIYRNGEFTDLCAGPHVMRTGNIGAFKLTHVASAYYKGDEKNPQLQRIYGTAFKNKTQMDEYFAMLEGSSHRFVQALRIVAEVDTATVFHCAAGKDRTGLLAALLLSLLGVSDKQIGHDYGLTAEVLPHLVARWEERLKDPRFDRPSAARDGVRRALTADPNTLAIVLASLRERFGSPEQWLVNHGLEPEVADRLRKRLLV